MEGFSLTWYRHGFISRRADADPGVAYASLASSTSSTASEASVDLGSRLYWGSLLTSSQTLQAGDDMFG